MRKWVEGHHDCIEGQHVVVVLRCLGGKLQFPAFHDLLEAKVTGCWDQETNDPMPDGDLLSD